MYILRIGIGRRGRNEDQEKIKTAFKKYRNVWSEE